MGYSQNLRAGAWIITEGQLNIKFSYFRLKSDLRFASSNFYCGSSACIDKSIEPYFFNGALASHGVFTDIAYGISNRMDLKIQLPFYSISFKDDIDPERATSNNFGDMRIIHRYNLIKKGLVVTYKSIIKLPTGFFNKDAEVVPVGDGQFDIMPAIQISRSIISGKAFLSMDVGYNIRLRPKLKVSNLKPGNEFQYFLEFGYKARKNLLLKASLEAIIGSEFRSYFNKNESLVLNGTERRINYFIPSIYWVIKNKVTIEPLIKIALVGKNFPAGTVYGIGVSINI